MKTCILLVVVAESLLGLARGMCQWEMSTQLTLCVVLVQVMFVRHQKQQMKLINQ